MIVIISILHVSGDYQYAVPSTRILALGSMDEVSTTKRDGVFPGIPEKITDFSDALMVVRVRRYVGRVRLGQRY